MSTKYFTIGEMAQICQISTKALRYYDKINLLKPAYIDEETGYRYYTQEQIVIIMRIIVLRDEDFSINEVEQYLKTGNYKDLMVIYQNRRNRVDEELERLLQIKDEVEHQLNAFEEISFIEKNKQWIEPTVQIKNIPNRFVVTYREKIPFTIEDLAYRFTKIHNIMRENNLGVLEPYINVFHDNYGEIFLGLKDKHIDFESCMYIKKHIAHNPNFTRTIPSGLYATIVHRGSFLGSIDYYNFLVNWIIDNGYTRIGPTIKIYYLGIHHTKSPDDILSELQILVKK